MVMAEVESLTGVRTELEEAMVMAEGEAMVMAEG